MVSVVPNTMAVFQDNWSILLIKCKIWLAIISLLVKCMGVMPIVYICEIGAVRTSLINATIGGDRVQEFVFFYVGDCLS